MTHKIGFIGAGKIVEVIIKALSPGMEPGSMFIWNRTPENARRLAEEYGLLQCADLEELAHAADWLFLAVKPFAVAEVLKNATRYIPPESTLVSMAAGISIDKIKAHFTVPPKIIRIMPNLPLSVGLGMTAVCADPSVSSRETDDLLELFRRAGRAQLVEERLFDTVTALSGSGPAFAFLFIESMADGAVLNGMSRKLAYEFAAQTVMGAAKIILESGKHPGELKDIVASPAGTTMAGIHSMERQAFRSIVMDAVDAAAKRSKELNS